MSSGFSRAAAEDQAADGEAEPERPERECSDRDELSPEGQALPVAYRLGLLRGERLATPLLPYRASGPKAEIDVVEQLRRLVGHGSSLA
jgi:hypothetical protein